MPRIFQYVFRFSCLAALLISQNAVKAQEIVPLPEVQSDSIELPMFHSGWFGLSNGVLQGSAVSVSEAGDPIAAAGAKVTLIQASGSKVSVADDTGLFTFSDVAPGTYRLAIDSDKGFSTFAFKTVTIVGGNAPVARAYISTLPRSMVEEAFTSMWSPEMNEAKGNIIGSKIVPQTLSNQTPLVKMKGGLVFGELIFESSSAIPNKHVVKVFDSAGTLLTTERVDSLGKFSFAPKRAGLFNVLVGGGAHACVPVVVVAEQASVSALHNGTKFVGMVQSGASDSLVIPVIGPGTQDQENPPMVVDLQPLPEGFPIGGGGGFPGGGGGGTGGGGSGGGGGGLGGAGGLLGIAGLALGATALANDDGFNGNLASLIAP